MLKKLSLLIPLLTTHAYLALSVCSQHPDSTLVAPTVVGVPPSDAYIGLSLLETGEIRHYNYGEQAEKGTFYLSSADKGVTWTKVSVPDQIPFADVRSPISGEYVRLLSTSGMGLYALRTAGGIDGGRQLIKISDSTATMLKPPVFIRNGKRIVVGGHRGRGLHKGSFTFVSDDDGLTWQRSTLVTAPDHKGGGFHNGLRWNHGAVEPTVVELNDGRLWMLARTSQDHHYQSFSFDGGLTWEEATPSPFYGTITMPTIGRLKDGRLLFLWNNTTPLPEVDNTDGVWDDVFTNRDAVHAAISSDDGKTWQGFRELYLSPRRNAADFGDTPGVDKSVHQSQFVEVDSGQVLVSLGQHPLHRVMLRFDVDWLYAKERFCDFSDGLDQWSVFNYYKGIVGHCGYNRTPGCSLLGGNLQIKYIENDSLLTSRRGAVWNFPAFRKGQFTASIRFNEVDTRGELLLNDRWFNPTDTVARYYAPFAIPLNPKKLKIEGADFHLLRIAWDIDAPQPQAVVYVDNKERMTVPLAKASLHGLSYVHFLSDNRIDDRGYEIEWVKAEKQ